MTSIEFIVRLSNILSRARAKELSDLLAGISSVGGATPVIPNEKDLFTSLMFALRDAVTTAARDPIDQELLPVLGLAHYGDAAFVGQQIATFRSASQKHGIAANPDFMMLQVHLRTLQDVVDGLRKAVLESKETPVLAGQGTFDLQVSDYDEGAVPAARLASVLDDLRNLYEDIGRSLGSETSALRIRYIESGSDIRISLEGAGDAIRAISDLFSEAWERIRNRRHRDATAAFASLRDGMEAVAELRKRVKDDDFPADEAARLERAISTRLESLLSQGVLPQHIEAAESFDRDRVLRTVRDVKLLGAGTTEEATDAESRRDSPAS